MKFLHMPSKGRQQDQLGRDMNPRAITVGYTVRKDGDKMFVEGQLAKCCWQDNFCKKFGRAICEGRMKKYGPKFSIEIYENMFTPYEVLVEHYHPDYGIAVFG